MTDRELLELAAKAAGVGDVDLVGRPSVLVIKDSGIYQRGWNPLVYDDDALRLAVKLRLPLSFDDWADGETVYIEKNGRIQTENFEHSDPYAATRRAIVRAAAEIGEGDGMTTLREAATQALEALETARPLMQPVNFRDWGGPRAAAYEQHNRAIAALRAALEQSEPPRREWRGLTDGEQRLCAQAMDAEPLAEGWSELGKFARAIEQALRSKNEQA